MGASIRPSYRALAVSCPSFLCFRNPSGAGAGGDHLYPRGGPQTILATALWSDVMVVTVSAH